MSIHSHLGKAQSRRDDLESIGYVLIYFFNGRLPWQGFKTNNGNVKEKYRKIRDAKIKMPIKALCDGLPNEFLSYMNYVKCLRYLETPDYEVLKDLFHRLYEAKGYSYDSPDFDWYQYGDLPSDVNK
jgi:serine/threonine protein kinase